MTDSLLAFLRARLDEDERTARGVAWESSRNRLAWELVASATIDVGGFDLGVNDSGVADHIARHDPARVLAEVAAKRQVVDRYERAMASRRAHPDDLATAGALLALHGVVQLLVLPFRDRPDFDASWAVDAPQ